MQHGDQGRITDRLNYNRNPCTHNIVITIIRDGGDDLNGTTDIKDTIIT